MKKISKIFFASITIIIFLSSILILCRRSVAVSEKSASETEEMVEDTRKKYIVPNLVGEKYDDVSSSKIVKSEEEYDDNIPEGCIIAQSVAPGTTKYTDDLITVKVSKGATSVELPDITGKSVGEACMELSSLGFIPEVVFVDNNEEEEGIVLGYSNTSAGKKEPRGHKIFIDVSN